MSKTIEVVFEIADRGRLVRVRFYRDATRTKWLIAASCHGDTRKILWPNHPDKNGKTWRPCETHAAKLAREAVADWRRKGL